MLSVYTNMGPMQSCYSAVMQPIYSQRGASDEPWAPEWIDQRLACCMLQRKLHSMTYYRKMYAALHGAMHIVLHAVLNAVLYVVL